MSTPFLKLLHAERLARELKHADKLKYIDIEREDLKLIIKAVIKYYGYPRRSVFAKSNHPALVEVRYMIYFISNVIYGISTIKIAHNIGKRHHTNVIQGRDKIAFLIENNDKDVIGHLNNIKFNLGVT